MSVDVAAIAPATPPRERPAPPASPASETLTRRASLNAVGSLLDYAAKIGVGLVITPVLVGGLGRTMFGVWEMLGRLMTYAHATDGRPTEALRLVVARDQAGVDPAAGRRYVGAALVVWTMVLPLVAAVGAAAAWLAPALAKAPPDQAGTVRLTCALLVASFVLASLASVPESVLRGMNLGYRRMGVQALLNVAGGGLAALAVVGGLGLVGLATSQIVRGVLTGVVFCLLVRRFVSWFGIARPRWPDVRLLLRMSVWLTAGELTAKVLLASDVLVLGALVSPAMVTTYVLTGYAARTAAGIHIFAAGAAMPGFGGVIGQRQLTRAAGARQEMLALTWLFVTAVGATILACNRSFLGLWVGAEHYAGTGVDLLLVLITAQTAFIRTDAYIIDAALQPRARVLAGAVTAVVTVALTLALTHRFGITGLCVGTLLGRSVQSVAYPVLVRRCLGEVGGSGIDGIRLGAVTALLFAAAGLVGQQMRAATWIAWAAAVPCSLALFGGAALALGPRGAMRAALAGRLRAMAGSLRWPR